jgi:putative ATPase
MKDLNYGKNYKYSHDFPNHFVEQQFLPDALQNRSIWKVQENPAEKKLGEWLRMLWKGRF